MEFSISEDVRAVGDSVERFTRENLIPLEKAMSAREWAADPAVSILAQEDLRRLDDTSRAMGLWGLDVPKEFGGLDLGAQAKFEAMRRLRYSITPFMLPPDSPNLYLLQRCCKGSQIDKYLLPYVRGEKTSCLALTEPSGGSDLSAIKTRAVRQGGKWVINGQKLWISNAAKSDFMVLIAVTDPEKGSRGGMTAFLVDKGTAGMTVSERFPVVVRSNSVHAVFFENMVLEDEQVLGEVGQIFPVLQQRLGVRRIEIAADSIGKAERCLDLMIEYANQRSTFGQLLADRQVVQFWIADSYQELEMVKLCARRLAWRIDNPDADDKQRTVRREAAMLKVQATEMATRVVDRAIQLHGALGVSAELPFEYMMRSLRIMRIGEGASEIHRWTIARDLLKNGMPRD